MSLTQVASQSIIQLGGAMVIGGVADALFPVDVTVDRANVVRVIGEVVLQTIYNAFAFISFVDMSERRLGASRLDPLKGIVYMMVLNATQPHYMQKIKNLVLYFTQWIHDSYGGMPSSVVPLAGKAATSTSRDSHGQMMTSSNRDVDVPAGLDDEMGLVF